MKKKSRKTVKTAKRNTSTKRGSKTKPKAKKTVKKKNVRSSKEDLKEAVLHGNTPNELTVLEQLFGGQSKMRLWKIFCLNPHKEFTSKQLQTLTRLKLDLLIPDLKHLMKQGVIKGIRKVVVENFRREARIVYKMNTDFPLLPALTETILLAIPRTPEKVLNHIQDLPKLKMVLLSSFFVSLNDSTNHSSVDMLLVFEKIPAQVGKVIAELERGLGRELRYAALDQEDFKYRHSIGDRLIRDVLDFDHVVAMDKMGFFR